MLLTVLKAGRFIRRYKRFFVEIQLLDDNQIVVAHCANTGKMTNLLSVNALVWLTANTNPQRRLAWRWELIELTGFTPKALVMINTLRANKLVEEALTACLWPEMAIYSNWQREVKVEDSRLDFCLWDAENKPAFLEVKQVTLIDQKGQGYFPDTVSLRAIKHVQILEKLAKAKQRSILVFCVTHSAIEQVSPAWHIDRNYAQALCHAVDAGVEVYAYRCQITFNETRCQASLCLNQRLPINLAPMI